MGEEPSAAGDDDISHGICDNCTNNIAFQSGVDLETYVDSLETPVLIVDGCDTVLFANRSARTLVGKDLPRIRGHTRGHVFECAYARLPEGCGRTPHCSGCAIRHAVHTTFGTGKSIEKLPATLRYQREDGAGAVRYLVSTRKAGDVVLLRVEDVQPAKPKAPPLAGAGK
jgi:transcriptional regulator of aromatic amino acid metabolism